MAKRNPKGTIENEIFNTMWQFYKAYGTPEDSEEYWDDVVVKGSANLGRAEKYKGHWELSSELYKAICNVLDARHRSMKKFGDESHAYDIMLDDLERANKESAERLKKIRELEKEVERLKAMLPQ